MNSGIREATRSTCVPDDADPSLQLRLARVDDVDLVSGDAQPLVQL